LHNFFTHVVEGVNFATGKKGSPIDFLAFHAKGRPRFIEGRVQMGSEYQLRDLDHGFATVASFPTLKHLPIIIGESDPEGCAACSASSYPQNAYRNGTVYSSYTAATFARKFDLAQRHGVNLQGAVTWAFEFEDQPYFDGFRDLATNGIDKPVLNVFRMFGRMGGDRVAARSTGARELDSMVEKGVKGSADIAALASRQARRASVMVWNYHDDDLPAAAAAVALTVRGLPAGAVRLRHHRVDAAHSNSYEVWKKMGSPQKPTPAQYAELEQSGQLRELAPRSEPENQPGGGVDPVRLAAPGRLAAGV
jgi:xylan 1,4-beta-xylosidase